MKLFEHFNTRIGTQTIGPRYCFTEEGALVETAKGILEMGSDVIKICLAVDSYNIESERKYNLTELVSEEQSFKQVLDMPFKYFMMWAHPKFTEEFGALDFELNEENEKRLYEEIYNLASYLLKTYNNTGKVFLIGHWEGDWVLLKGYDREKEPEDRCIEGMIKNLAVRQRAIEDARQEIAHENVWVGHYAEVNRPLDAKVRGLKRMTNMVLPRVKLDMISYSSYDSLWPNRLTEALSYIEQNASFTDYFDNMFSKKVFVGEYDGYRDYHVHGYAAPEKQAENALEIITSAISWGCPFVLYWEYYNNESERLIHGGGFWMVDEHGEKQPVYYMHKRLLEKLNEIKELYRLLLDRNPYEVEINELIDGLDKRDMAKLKADILNSEEYRQLKAIK